MENIYISTNAILWRYFEHVVTLLKYVIQVLKKQ